MFASKLFPPKTIDIFLAVIASIFITIFIILGNWQLKRLEEKKLFIHAIENNMVNPPVEIVDNKQQLNLYDKIIIRGNFLEDSDVFLYGRRSAYPEKDGYYLLTPFQDRFGNKYMVSRGWLPQTIKNQIDKFHMDGEATITAFVMKGETASYFAPENDLKKNIWFNIDLTLAHKRYGTNEKIYLLQIDNTNLPSGAYPLSAKFLSVVRNDHLEYAITWYLLAIIVMVVFIARLRKTFGCSSKKNLQ